MERPGLAHRSRRQVRSPSSLPCPGWARGFDRARCGPTAPKNGHLRSRDPRLNASNRGLRDPALRLAGPDGTDFITPRHRPATRRWVRASLAALEERCSLTEGAAKPSSSRLRRLGPPRRDAGAGGLDGAAARAWCPDSHYTARVIRIPTPRPDRLCRLGARLRRRRAAALIQPPVAGQRVVSNVHLWECLMPSEVRWRAPRVRAGVDRGSNRRNARSQDGRPITAATSRPPPLRPTSGQGAIFIEIGRVLRARRGLSAHGSARRCARGRARVSRLDATCRW